MRRSACSGAPVLPTRFSSKVFVPLTRNRRACTPRPLKSRCDIWHALVPQFYPLVFANFLPPITYVLPQSFLASYQAINHFCPKIFRPPNKLLNHAHAHTQANAASTPGSPRPTRPCWAQSTRTATWPSSARTPRAARSPFSLPKAASGGVARSTVATNKLFAVFTLSPSFVVCLVMAWCMSRRSHSAV